MAKIIRKKSATKKTATAAVESDPNREFDKVENWEVTEKKKETPKGPAKRISKVLSLHISIGDSDRDRDMEEFLKDIEKRLGVVPYGQDGVHLTQMGSYYLLDGLVCLPHDFDSKAKTFKEGATPPSWAGGPPPKPAVADDVSGGKWERTSISAKEWDKKYPNGNPNKILPKTDDDLEEIDWEAEMENTDEHEETAKKTIAKAKKVLNTNAPVKTTKVIRKVKKK